MATPPKLGTLVAIPIKGRKLVNRTGGKQSPYVQLKLGHEQKKRTRASLIASVEPEWDQELRIEVYHGQFDMHVAVYDDGKKNELIGEGVLLLHEVIDKGELDVWFPIKNNGTSAGDIYFELTFYASGPLPPISGAGTPPIPQALIQTPALPPAFHGSPGHTVPHTPPTSGFGSPPVAPPFPGGVYPQPGFSSSPRPFAPPAAFPPTAAPPFGGAAPTPGPAFNQPFGAAASPFRPPGASPFPGNAAPFGAPNAPGPYQNQMPLMPQPFPNALTNNNINNNNAPGRFPSPGNQNMNAGPPFPQGPGGPPNTFPGSGPNNNNNFNNGPPHSFPNSNIHNNNNNNFNNGPGNNGNFNNMNNAGGNNNNFNNQNTNFNNNNQNNFNNNNNQGPNNNFNNQGNNNNFGNNNQRNSNFNNHNNNNMNLNRNNNTNNNNNNNNQSPGNNPGGPVTPLVQYNYSLGSFP